MPHLVSGIRDLACFAPANNAKPRHIEGAKEIMRKLSPLFLICHSKPLCIVLRGSPVSSRSISLLYFLALILLHCLFYIFGAGIHLLSFYLRCTTFAFPRFPEAVFIQGRCLRITVF
jgi:hypothetical protein